MKSFANLYYKRSFLPFLLLPVALLYYVIIRLRKWGYGIGLLTSKKLPVPVIIVGNITLGGTGKTPLVIYLIELLRKQGYKPGVISRGYGATIKHFPYEITQNAQAKAVGDEPTLIFQRTGVPMVIDPKRVRAGEYLLEHHNCDVIISDDGLQHYALQRDIEIAVVDGERGFGNGLLFPAGPLREPQSRLKTVDHIVYQGGGAKKNRMYLKPEVFCNIHTQEEQPLDFFKGQSVIAMAGIGHPQRFFHTLESLEIKVLKHPLPDHYTYSVADFEGIHQPVIMTEKDAVKCVDFGKSNLWYLKVSAALGEDWGEGVLKQLPW